MNKSYSIVNCKVTFCGLPVKARQPCYCQLEKMVYYQSIPLHIDCQLQAGILAIVGWIYLHIDCQLQAGSLALVGWIVDIPSYRLLAVGRQPGYSWLDSGYTFIQTASCRQVAWLQLAGYTGLTSLAVSFSSLPEASRQRKKLPSKIYSQCRLNQKKVLDSLEVSK